MALCFWYLENTGALEALFASLTFVIGFLPTFRKAYKKPRQETAITFFLNGLKFLLAIAALESISLSTLLYPLVVSAMNLGFVGYLLMRRSVVKH